MIVNDFIENRHRNICYGLCALPNASVFIAHRDKPTVSAHSGEAFLINSDDKENSFSIIAPRSWYNNYLYINRGSFEDYEGIIADLKYILAVSAWQWRGRETQDAYAYMRDRDIAFRRTGSTRKRFH